MSSDVINLFTEHYCYPANMTYDNTEELEKAKQRAKKLAMEKSYLQLIIQLMSRVSAVSGLDNTVDNLLHAVIDVIGGANLILYYQIDDDIFYADVYGKKQKLQTITDPQVADVYQTGQPIEYKHGFADTQLVSAEFTSAYTWVFPLKVGNQLIGVFKMESLHIAMRELYEHLPVFFNYVALILKNEILGYTRLQHINQQLEEEIIHRKQVEKDLRHAKVIAEEANQAKSVFLANMSHELRTPMNAVLGFSKIMQSDPEITESQRQYLNIINRSGSHLLSLINDILDMAKIEAGRIVIEPEAFDLGETIRDIVDMMRERAESKHLRLSHEEHSGFPRFVETDPYKLRQILINLIGNAIKYTDHGGVSLRFDMKPHQDDNKAWLICEIEDSGVGIEQQDLTKIFEPFVQVGRNMSQKGTGLGLPITKQYIQLMGGTISVSSEINKGSLFRLELPVNKVSETEIMAIKPPQQRQIVGLAPNQQLYRLLIVDDNSDGRLLLRKVLQPLGFQLKEAANGEEAVTIFQQWQPHLIWMDMRMPVMDGKEATKIIKSLPNGKETLVVALTASVFEDQREELFKAGVDAFVSKPYRIEEIFTCLHQYLKVEFIYQDLATETSTLLTPEYISQIERFKRLPVELQTQLQEAATALDIEQTAHVIAEIKSQDETIATNIQQYLEQMDFQAILDLCDKRA
jgi:signal transduction histidine kinase/CheY-like chemotaxis protein